ncbi:MAG TPA: hypothetical protein VGR61_11205 [Candidatus Dormibacteraeota bacterium]|nr:hypothetical protein [Candidatus Dormibacteraeota bacterium]
MNYDTFEREVIGYQSAMRCRAERSRVLRAGQGAATDGHPVRFRVAGALRTLANHLDARPAHLA